MGRVRYYWKKYIWNTPFMVAAVAMGLVYYKVGKVEQATVGMMILEGLNFADAVSPAMHFVPVMACLPYVMKFHEERNSRGSLYAAVLRTGRKRYAIKKVSEAAYSGALVMLSALTVYSLLICAYAAAHGLGVHFDSGLVQDTIYESWIEEGFGFAAYLVTVCMLTLQGAVWACIGTVVGLFMRNRRLAVVGPFLIEWALESVIPEALWFLNPYWLNFRYWTMMQPLGGIPYVLIYTIVALVLSTVIVYFGMRRIMGR